MREIDIYVKARQSFLAKRPFVIFRKPDDNILHGWFQDDDKFYSYDFSGISGFVMAPFNAEKVNYFIPENKSQQLKCIVTKQPLLRPQFTEKAQEKSEKKGSKDYINLVRKAIFFINSGELSKVVLSRKEKVVCNKTFDQIFAVMHQLYPKAFCYFWYHPVTGCWTGATPEILFCHENDTYTTMSLAGTRKLNSKFDNPWGSKEIREQEMVTEAVVKIISNYTSDINLEGPKTSSAGNIEHLRTKITGNIGRRHIDALVRELHPTPAVCGTPRDSAKKFILANESYDREFYTGYLGLIHKKQKDGANTKTELYVNLRCMKIEGSNAFIYIGGGITGQSNPEAEWEETVNKSETMKKVVLNIPK